MRSSPRVCTLVLFIGDRLNRECTFDGRRLIFISAVTFYNYPTQEFSDIFRRAFASRVFPPDVVEQLGEPIHMYLFYVCFVTHNRL